MSAPPVRTRRRRSVSPVRPSNLLLSPNMSHHHSTASLHVEDDNNGDDNDDLEGQSEADGNEDKDKTDL